MRVRGAILAAGVALALGGLYLVALAGWASSPGLYPSNQVEWLVLLSFALRATAYLGVPALRRTSFANVVILFGIDAFMIIGAALLLVVTGYSSIREFGRSYIYAWVGAGVLVYPAPAVFMICRDVIKGGRLASVVPSASTLFLTLALAASALGGTNSSGGLGEVAELMLQGVRGGSAQLTWTPLVAVCGGILFASLVVKSVAGEKGSGGAQWARLSLVLLGVLGMLAWVAAVGEAWGPWVAFGAPVGAAAAAAAAVSRLG